MSETKKKKKVKYFQPLQKIILGSFRLGFTMGKCKVKAVQAYSRIFGHIQTYSGIIRYIQELSRHIQAFSEPCIAQTYLEPWQNLESRTQDPWHIQNQTHIQNPGIFRILVYSEPWHIQSPVKQLPCSILPKQLTAIITFAISAFHVLSYMKKM